MAVKRVLADCVVLSLQDSSLFYPSCRGCFSRIDVEQAGGTRCRCCKCGYSCSRELVDYRYRLSVWATREDRIFGITVFGSCLNSFFGIDASGLKRLLENVDGPTGASVRSTLLKRAVEDCFVGRRFIFGLKLSDTERFPWVVGPAPKGSCSAEKIQVIASQMIPPHASALGGCTVVSFYRALLQKAAHCELGLAESSVLCRPAGVAPLLICPRAEAGSCEHDASGFGHLSLQRTLMHQDSSLSPTPPFQQSLGLVTSSAEPDCCSNGDSVDQGSSQTGEFLTPPPSQRRDPNDLNDAQAIRTSLSFSSPLAAHYSRETFRGPSGNSCTSLSPARDSSPSSTPEFDKASLADPVVGENLPLSESLSKFLCEENMVYNISQTGQHVNVQNHEETPRNNSKIKSRERNLTRKSTQMAHRRLQTLLNITNTERLAHHELAEHVCRNPARSIARRHCKNPTSDKNNPEQSKTSWLSVDDGGREEGFGRDSHNFSADLFSGSFVNEATRDTQTETVWTSSPGLPEAGQSSSERDTMRESFIPAASQDLDFVPPSQSTPIVKAAPGCWHRPNRFCHSSNPPRSFRKVGGDKHQLLLQQHLGTPMVSPSVGSAERIHCQCDPGGSNPTDLTEDRLIFPPTPVARTKQIRKGPARMRVDCNSVSFAPTWAEHRVPCKRVKLNRTPPASHTQTGSCGGGAMGQSSLEGWTDDSNVGNYSRDLFSDSV